MFFPDALLASCHIASQLPDRKPYRITIRSATGSKSFRLDGECLKHGDGRYKKLIDLALLDLDDSRFLVEDATDAAIRVIERAIMKKMDEQEGK
ncbi:MAG: hypothetical protein HY816_16355 [Candidatus Wallbacteria bacterium]|nr:hypothetical protein [Candidatus Wallbacteria bacterium]